METLTFRDKRRGFSSRRHVFKEKWRISQEEKVHIFTIRFTSVHKKCHMP